MMDFHAGSRLNIMRVLVLAHYFPPYQTAQSRINLATVYAMQDKGIQPVIVTSEVPKGLVDEAFIKILENLNIYRYQEIRYNSIINVLRGKLRIPRHQNIFAGIHGRIFKTALKAIKDHKIEMVYSISSIGDTHRTGMMIAQRLAIPWIAEFQDPWLENTTFNEWLKSSTLGIYRYYLRIRTNLFLRLILKTASLVVTESESHYNLLSTRAKEWGINSDKIVFAYLGSDPSIIDRLGEPNIPDAIRKLNMFKIGFVGAVYYGYEERVRHLIRSLRILEREGVKFCFITVGCSVLPRLATEEGFKSIISIDTLPYRDAVGIMKFLDLGVTIPSSNININSKLFDYLIQGCRVLVWGCLDGEMASIVRKHNCGIVIDDSDEYRAAYELRNYITGSNNNSRLDFEDKRWFTRRELLNRCWSK